MRARQTALNGVRERRGCSDNTSGGLRKHQPTLPLVAFLPVRFYLCSELHQLDNHRREGKPLLLPHRRFFDGGGRSRTPTIMRARQTALNGVRERRGCSDNASGGLRKHQPTLPLAAFLPVRFNLCSELHQLDNNRREGKPLLLPHRRFFRWGRQPSVPIIVRQHRHRDKGRAEEKQDDREW